MCPHIVCRGKKTPSYESLASTSCLPLSRSLSLLVKRREQCTQGGSDTDPRRQNACQDALGWHVNTLGCPQKRKVEPSGSGSNSRSFEGHYLLLTLFLRIHPLSLPCRSLSFFYNLSLCSCLQQACPRAGGSRRNSTGRTLSAKWGLNRCLKHIGTHICVRLDGRGPPLQRSLLAKRQRKKGEGTHNVVT